MDKITKNTFNFSPLCAIIVKGDIMKNKFLGFVLIFISVTAGALIFRSTYRAYQEHKQAYLDSIGTDKALNGEVSLDDVLNAREYVNKKYNINAYVISSGRDYEWEGFDFIIPHKEYTGTYSYIMEADSRRFNVLVSASGIKDDYQQYEINDKMTSFFGDMLGEGVETRYSGGMYSEILDCSDVEKFLCEYQPIVKIYAVNIDMDSENVRKFKDFAGKCKSDIWLMSCRSEKDRDLLLNGMKNYVQQWAYLTETSFGDDYALWVKEIWRCTYNSADDTYTTDHAEPKIGNCGDLYYTVPENSDVTITESNARYYSDSYDEKYKLLTPAFKIKCRDNITLFYPVEKADRAEMKYYEAYKCGGNIVEIKGGYFIYRIHTEKWYEDNHYYTKGDEKVFGIYIDNYY